MLQITVHEEALNSPVYNEQGGVCNYGDMWCALSKHPDAPSDMFELWKQADEEPSKFAKLTDEKFVEIVEFLCAQ